MLTYCLKYKKDRESVDSKMLKTKNGRTMLSSKQKDWLQLDSNPEPLSS